jgi:hypothetical protein
VIGGAGVNAYADPVTLDLDVVVAAEQIDALAKSLKRQFTVERFAHSINVSVPNSKLRIQFSTPLRPLRQRRGRRKRHNTEKQSNGDTNGEDRTSSLFVSVASNTQDRRADEAKAVRALRRA